MESEPTRAAPEQWLEHAAWLNKLARSLVADPNVADDLVQDTWVASLRHAPQADRPLRPWLARVLTNFARQKQRSEASRALREQRSDEKDPWPSASDLVSRLESQRLLVDALLRIDEPFRETIVLRYFEDKSAADIARTKGIPQPTVRWRLMRGLELLRAELDRSNGGDRSAWTLALVPLCRSASTLAPNSGGVSALVATGALVMNAGTKFTIGVGVLVMVVLGIWWLVADSSPTRSPIGTQPMLSAASADLGDEAMEAQRALAERTSGAIAAPSSAEASATPVARVECRVVDAQRRPLLGARLRIGEWSGAPSSSSDADGRIALELAPRVDGAERQRDWAEIEIAHPEAATTHLGVRVSFERTTYLGTIELRPAGSVSGLVTDERGAPIEGALVFAQVTGEPFVLSGSAGPFVGHQFQRPDSAYLCSIVHARVARTRTGADGSYRIDRLRAGFVRVWAARPLLSAGYSELLDVRAGEDVPCPPIRLNEPRASESIRGRVIDPDGQPVRGVDVSLEEYVNTTGFGVVTDDDGRFVLPAAVKSANVLICTDNKRRWPDVVTTLDSPARDLELRFENAQTLRVRALDPDATPLTAFGVAVCGPENGSEIFVEPVASRPSGELVVMLPRTKYHLVVHAPGHTLVNTPDLDPHNTPPTMEFKLERPAGVRGRVLDHGQPVAGARVQMIQMLHKGWCKEIHDVGAIGGPLLSLVFGPNTGEAVTTDASGAFALRLLPGEPNLLRVEKRGRAPFLRWSISEPIDGLEIEFGSGGSIEGSVERAEGEDRSGTLIGASCGDGFVVSVRTDPAGHYRFDQLNPGAWQVRVLEREQTPREERMTIMEAGFQVEEPKFDCTVVDGEVTRVDFRARDLVRPRLHGCLRIDGKPVDDWTVMLVKVRAGGLPLRTSQHVGPDGCFDVTVAEHGRWDLQMWNAQSTGVGLRIFDRWDASSAPSEWSCELQTGVVAGRTGLKVPVRDTYCAVTDLDGDRACVSMFQPGSDRLWPTTVGAGNVRIARRLPNQMLDDILEQPALATITVRPGQTVEFDLR